MIGHITIINIVVGVWWGIFYAQAFYHFMGGGYIHEPNVTMATIEFAVGIIGTLWFLWQIPYWWIKMKRRKNNAS